MNPQDAILKMYTLGWNDVQIALATGIHKSNIGRIAKGSSKASYANGVALVEMAKRSRKPIKVKK